MKKIFIPALCALVLWGCQNLEDAKLTERNSFIHFYEGAYSMTAANAEVTSDGYVISGTINVTGNKKASRIVVIKTDKLGRKIWQEVIDNAIASSIKVVPNGYLVIGNSVEYNPNTSNISELENFNSRLVLLNTDGNVIRDVSSYPRKNAENLHIDYYGDAVTIDETTQTIITLGTFHEAGKSEFSYVSALHPGTFDTLWTREFNYIVRDYVNAKSVHYENGKILWGTSITETINAFNYSYMAVPVVIENSTFINSNYYGQNQEQQVMRIRDMQKSPHGYAAVGTFSKPDGTNSDLFFIKIDRNGNFQQESILYFDGLTGLLNQALTEPSLSDVTEAGEAITATRDGGFVLAGSLTTDEGKGIGNGGTDVWLIKIDGFGIPQWNKIIGGSTNERVRSICETEDGSLLICGTIQDGSDQSGGLSSIFLIKTDKNGELKK